MAWMLKVIGISLKWKIYSLCMISMQIVTMAKCKDNCYYTTRVIGWLDVEIAWYAGVEAVVVTTKC